MKQKNQTGKRIISMLLAIALLLSGITFLPRKAYAAGWLEYAQKTITLGTAVSASIKDGDYYGLTELSTYTKNYWHIYKFTMPKKGLLNIYLESLSEQYLRYDGDSAFAIYSSSDPDTIVWRSYHKQNKIQKNYSASRAMYYGSTEIALEGGDYYFAVRQLYTNNNPYYLTLSYKEPVINVSSISLSPASLSMEPGGQRTIIPAVLPDNATDKTVVWKSENPSIATVENGIVKALSAGTTTITASSADGEITATCPVVVKCEHSYQTSLIPASIEKEGSVTEICSKCGEETKTSIPRIDKIELSQTAYVYDGKEHRPDVAVTDKKGNVLKAGKDYTIFYSENTANIGEHTVTVNFIGNYEGTQTKKFTVSPIPVEAISLETSGFTLDIGSQKEITVTVLPEDATDKTVTWESGDPSVATVENGIVKAISIGTTTITVTANDGGETAECTVSVTCPHSYRTTLIPADKSKNGSLKEECKKCGHIRQNITIYAIREIHLPKTSYTYNGKVCSPAVNVTDSSGRQLKKDKDYVVSYSGNRKDVGIYHVVVKFKGNYKGSETKRFTIYPKSAKITRIKAKRKGFTVNWKKQAAQISGYELAYSADGSFRNKTKVVTLSKNKTGKTVGRLKKGKRYYVRIRTYKKVTADGRTAKLYSGWSKVKSVVIRG